MKGCFLSLLVVLVGVPIFVNADTNELNTAREALRDGLYDVARRHAALVDSDDAKLIILESLAREGRRDQLEKALEDWPNAKGTGFDYYRAFLRNDRATMSKILSKCGDLEGEVAAEINEADLLYAAGETNKAVKIWHQLSTLTNLNEKTRLVIAGKLGNKDALKHIFEETDDQDIRYQAGIRYSLELLKVPESEEVGERIIREICKKTPDAPNALSGMVALGECMLQRHKWAKALEVFKDIVEYWPETSQQAEIQDSLGWALLKVGAPQEALEMFERAEKLSKDEERKAMEIIKQGDALVALKNETEAMAKYRMVLEKYPKTRVSEHARLIVRVKELELAGRADYREYRFEEALRKFREISTLSLESKPRMDYFAVLCQFGMGNDADAEKLARKIIENGLDEKIRAATALWLAKFEYNRGGWKEAEKFFRLAAELVHDEKRVVEALVWTAQSKFAAGDFEGAVKLAVEIVERWPKSERKLEIMKIKGLALMELGRFEEAAMAFDFVGAKLQMADAMFALGADNPKCYERAFSIYSELDGEGDNAPGEKIVIAFKLARTMEKLKKIDEAIDCYYSRVVLPYRTGRINGINFGEEERSAFLRSAFRVVDTCERRGEISQAINVLKLVMASDSAAAKEAEKHIHRLSKKGGR